MRRIFMLGVLLLFAGNVGLVWAEYYLPSGLSALLVAIVPVYVALIELLLPHGERLRSSGQIGLIFGFAGLGILAWPSAHAGLHGDWHQIFAIGVLLLGAFSFACGSIWSRQSKLSLNVFVCAGWQMLAASFCDLVLATCLRQWGHAHWNRDSFSAIAYLTVFGSLIGFSSYSWLLQNVPVTKVATYAYVNPMVAVLLGALLLGERLQGNEWIGMVIILVAVFLVTSSKMQPGHGAPEAPEGKADVVPSGM
jgi:drug/metabolite transporter (DMT)-like permease